MEVLDWGDRIAALYVYIFLPPLTFNIERKSTSHKISQLTEQVFRSLF